MNGGEHTLFSVDGAHRPPDTPLIYIASALTNLDEAQRRDIQWIDDEINTTLVRNGEDEGAAGPVVRVHSPYTHSNPNREDGRSPAQIYEMNVSLLHEQCDGLVVIAANGGSLGAGQELAWATALALPVLVVRRPEERLSRQVQGTAERYDIEVESFSSPAELRDIVSRWAATHRSAIEDGPRRRLERLGWAARLSAALQGEWRKRNDAERREIADLLHLSVERVSDLVTRPGLLSGAAVTEVSALGAALGLEMPGALFPSPFGELTGAEAEALAQAADEHQWPSAKVIRLAETGRLQKAKGGVRRFRLDSVGAWVAFEERAR